MLAPFDDFRRSKSVSGVCIGAGVNDQAQFVNLQKPRKLADFLARVNEGYRKSKLNALYPPHKELTRNRVTIVNSLTRGAVAGVV